MKNAILARLLFELAYLLFRAEIVVVLVGGSIIGALAILFLWW